MKGFKICIEGRDYFVPTKLVQKTKKAAKKIINQFACPVVTEEWIYNHMEMCDYEVTPLGYNLCGQKYGNPFTLLLPLGEHEDFISLKEV